MLGYNEIYNTYNQKIQHYLARIVGQDEAEDITQEVFIKINKSIGTLQDENKILLDLPHSTKCRPRPYQDEEIENTHCLIRGPFRCGRYRESIQTERIRGYTFENS